jgi:hypothetical protein
MHEFFLHEAQAQLQLALFGMDEEFMERTNKGIRDAFVGDALNCEKLVCFRQQLLPVPRRRFNPPPPGHHGCRAPLEAIWVGQGVATKAQVALWYTSVPPLVGQTTL